MSNYLKISILVGIIMGVLGALFLSSLKPAPPAASADNTPVSVTVPDIPGIIVTKITLPELASPSIYRIADTEYGVVCYVNPYSNSSPIFCVKESPR